MTTYAGEQFTVWQTATVDGAALTDADVTTEVEIVRNSDGTMVVELTAMAWSVERSRWEYLWDTTDYPPGGYRARVVIDGDTWEYKRYRLANNPDAFGIDPGDDD